MTGTLKSIEWTNNKLKKGSREETPQEEEKHMVKRIGKRIGYITIKVGDS